MQLAGGEEGQSKNEPPLRQPRRRQPADERALERSAATEQQRVRGRARVGEEAGADAVTR